MMNNSENPQLTIPRVVRSYWIYKTHYLCRICGHQWIESKRIYDTQKPKDFMDRNEFVCSQYHCVEL